MKGPLPFGVNAPSRERMRRAKADGSKIERVSGRELIDSDGQVSTPWRNVDTLELMYRQGAINSEMLAAGKNFQTTFAAAHLDPLRAADMGRVGYAKIAGGDGFGSRVEAARRRVAKWIRAAGGMTSPAGSCLWHVLGLGESLSQWAKTRGWAGRRVPPATASGILIVALGLLASPHAQK
jgi:hypothetical protein